MTLIHPSYRKMENGSIVYVDLPHGIPSVMFDDYIVRPRFYAYISRDGLMLVCKTKQNGKLWTAVRYSTISKQQLTIGKAYRTREAAMRAVIIAAQGGKYA